MYIHTYIFFFQICHFALPLINCTLHQNYQPKKDVLTVPPDWAAMPFPSCRDTDWSAHILASGVGGGWGETDDVGEGVPAVVDPGKSNLEGDIQDLSGRIPHLRDPTQPGIYRLSSRSHGKSC